jgi:hypothetical protein
MSSIGKIFVVLNLVLAAAFVGWAANAVNNSGEWKKKYEDATAAATKEKAQLETELSKVRADNQQIQNDKNKAISDKDEAGRALARVQQELKDEQSKNAALNADITKISTTLEQINASKDKAVDDAKKAVAAQKAAEEAKRAAEDAKAAAETAQADLEGKLRTAEEQIAGLEKEKTSLAKERQSLQTSLDTLVANTGVKLSDFQNVPKIEGAVLGVETSVAPGLVAINVGSNKGVKRGYTFEIYDGGTYKGQVRVEFVHADMCSGLITRTAPGQSMRQGDGATTRL